MKNVDNKARSNGTIIDSIIFVLFTGTLVCRLFVNEAFPASSPLPGDNIGGGIVGFGGLSFMLSFDMVLLFGSVIWLFLKLKVGDLYWRKTGMVVPVLLLLVGTVLSYWSSSDKSAALVYGLNLFSMMSAGLVMVQLLAEPSRRKILLAAVIGLGLCQVLRCYDQQSEHEITLQQMDDDYNVFMASQGLDPESWQARQFEERVRSRDTGGYFSISNTGSSYFLLTITGAGCVIAGVAGRKGGVPAGWFVGGLVVAVMMLGVWITESTGGKLSLAAMFAFASGMYILRNLRYRKILFGIFVLAVGAGVLMVAHYGQTHDRLPTSNLWIRWHYWQATARMIGDHWLAGVGPFNFGHYYSYYMNPSSPEFVKDPHCVALSIFSQWGVIGILSFLWATLGVLWLLVKRVEEKKDYDMDEASYPVFKVGLVAGILTMLIFLVRMISVDDSFGEIPSVAKMYLTLEPAVKFGIIFFLSGYIFMCRKEVRLNVGSGKTVVVLLAGLAGFALHNTIDFAFFQPGVGMLFFFMAALAISVKGTETVVLRSKLLLYGTAAGIVLLVVIMFLPGLGGGIYRTGKAVKEAERYVALSGRTHNLDYADTAIDLCLENAESCPNDVRSLYYAGRLCNQLWHYSDFKDDRYFDRAVSVLLRAAGRDSAHFRYYKLLGELYVKKGKRLKAGSEGRKSNNIKAVEYFTEYLERNPGNSDVLVMQAALQKELGDMQAAERLAKKALEIEKGCMELQPKLFPHRDVFYPRMDQELQKQAEEIVDVTAGGSE